jgi:hypothetical protein
MNFASSVSRKPHRPKLSQAEKNFERLTALGILNQKNANSFECSRKKGSSLKVLKKAHHPRSSVPYVYVISLSHSLETLDGKPLQDPLQDILINTNKKTAETISFSMSDLGVCKSIYFKGQAPRETSFNENNSFLTTWLSALIMQGFRAPLADL